MSSMSQQTHWLAKNRMLCTWSQHMLEEPHVMDFHREGGGGGGVVETLFPFSFFIQSLWIQLRNQSLLDQFNIRCTIILKY